MSQKIILDNCHLWDQVFHKNTFFNEEFNFRDVQQTINLRGSVAQLFSFSLFAMFQGWQLEDLKLWGLVWNEIFFILKSFYLTNKYVYKIYFGLLAWYIFPFYRIPSILHCFSSDRFYFAPTFQWLVDFIGKIHIFSLIK